MSRNDLKGQVEWTRSRSKILSLALREIVVPPTGILLGHCITFTARRSVSLYYPPLSLFGYIAAYHSALYGFLCFSALLWVGTIAFSVLTIAIEHCRSIRASACGEMRRGLSLWCSPV